LRAGFLDLPVIKDVVGDLRMTFQRVRAKRITLNIDPMEARDLLERVPRACVSFASDDGPQAELVTVHFKDDRLLVGLPSTAAAHVNVHQEVVLLVDEGCQFFDLRAIYVRGHVQPPAGREGPACNVVWFTVDPTRIVAWDYAQMREVDCES
jgi:hypothetical protein